MIKHKHHIIPKHIGGSDDPSNLIELTIEEHAEAHRKLFEEHGRWQDKLAWKSLSGQISGAEIARLKRIEVNRARRGKIVVSEETRQKIRETNIRKGRKPPSAVNSKSFKKGHTPWNTGKVNCFSEETITKMKESKVGNKFSAGKIRSEETKKKISIYRRGKGVGETNAMFLAENRKKVAQSKLGKKLYYNPQTKQKMFFYPNNVLENFFPIRKS
jgi:hypothetical protein